MYGNSRQLPGGGKPTEERKREYKQAGVVGGVLLAGHEAKQCKQAIIDAQEEASVPHKKEEHWQHRKKKDGMREPGRVKREVCRSAGGQFANLSRELAAHFGLKTGRDIPSPPPRER